MDQILANMKLAERIGQKYAYRNGRHVDESIAEAYFWLVSFFKETNLYQTKPEGYEFVLGCYIKRNLIKYFERLNPKFEPEKDKVVRNTDAEMLDYLSTIMTDDHAFEVFNHLRNGTPLSQVDLLDVHYRKVLKQIRLRVASRIRRLEELKSAGFPISREIIDACDSESEEANIDCGEHGRSENPVDVARESNQHEDDVSTSYQGKA
jgi:hypothetical protein